VTTSRWGVLFGIVLAATFAWAAYESLRWSELARLFPLSVAAFGLVLAALALVVPARAREDAEPEELSRRERTRRTLAATGWIAAFLVAVWALGFLVAIPLGSLAYLRLAGERWPLSAAISAGSWAFVYGLFDRLLHVPLPAGEVLRVLGAAG
jgi:hypothetical protein